MIFDFVFSKKELSKSQFFQWLIDTMLESGWENLSKNKTNVDYWTMFSTGESGNEKIGVQLRNFYYDTGYNFSSTVYGYISARAFNGYTENPAITTAGKFTPNDTFIDIRVVPNTTPDEKLNVYYHINKDRVIVVVENDVVSHSDILSSTFFVLGKPHTVAKYNEYCSSAVITSHGSYPCRSGIFEHDSMNLHFDSTFVDNMTTMFTSKNKNSKFAKNIVLQNSIDGYKYIVENIFTSTNNRNSLTVDMRKNTFKDEEGRVYKLFVSNFTSSIFNSAFRSFIIRIG